MLEPHLIIWRLPEVARDCVHFLVFPLFNFLHSYLGSVLGFVFCIASDLHRMEALVTHNLAVLGGGGLILSIITGLFGVNIDGMPEARNTRYAFGLFSGILFFLRIVLVAVGLLYLGLKKPLTEEQVKVRKLELVKMFQH
ncbi:hypothetical protein RJ639_026037 [Escallonia herrerae]|uniref:Uncharacterized protein n=1 Tax=Escallonia herrerae TaxID=1293975 RepID=A0AA88UXC0_9ASTE|nr:hypothetical protein RJ639_026037 [Escallonia herrerae]